MPGLLASSARAALHQLSLVGAVHGVKCSEDDQLRQRRHHDAPDYLDYLANDMETQVIAMYIEGVKDGPRFSGVAEGCRPKEARRRLERGRRRERGRAPSTHTPPRWPRRPPSGTRRCARQVSSGKGLDDTIDVVKALLYSKPATGKAHGDHRDDRRPVCGHHGCV